MKPGKTRKARRISTGSAIIEALQEAIEFKADKKTGATVRTVTARRAKPRLPEYRAEPIARPRLRMKEVDGPGGG